ncbi:MAG: recombinase family protein [Bryobacteraceae bacterium]|nr:recombinase family protein [Bryobacteraceae bacterium]
MGCSNRLRTKTAPRPRAGKNAVYARTAADDTAGTACRDQVHEALGLVEDARNAAVYTDARRSGLNANQPALLCLPADARRRGLRRAVVRDLARLARSAELLETTLGELRAARVELVTAGRTHWRA